MPNVFKRISIENKISGTLIQWELERQFFDLAPYSFYVYVGRNLTEEFTLLNSSPIVNSLGAIVSDNTQRLWGKDEQLFYKVKLVTNDGEYWSEPQPTATALSRRDWLLGRTISFNEYLWHRKFGGNKGWLLKRKRFGEKCPGKPKPGKPGQFIPCRDWDTDDVIDSNCPTCLGTGIEGGYYAPIEMYAVITQRASSSKNREPAGTTDQVVIEGRVLAYYSPTTYDVWIDEVSGRRFFVNSIKNLAEIRGVPLVCGIEMRLAPFTDPIYSFDISDLNVTPAFELI